MILMQEGLHEKEIADIADQIKAQTPDVKVVLITGPSSSGKTTFAGKLGIQLRINSLTPIKNFARRLLLKRRGRAATRGRLV